MIYGYVRVSTTAQGESGRGLAGQRDVILSRYPGTVMREEVRSGAKAYH